MGINDQAGIEIKYHTNISGGKNLPESSVEKRNRDQKKVKEGDWKSSVIEEVATHTAGHGPRSSVSEKKRGSRGTDEALRRPLRINVTNSLGGSCIVTTSIRSCYRTRMGSDYIRWLLTKRRRRFGEIGKGNNKEERDGGMGKAILLSIGHRRWAERKN